MNKSIFLSILFCVMAVFSSSYGMYIKNETGKTIAELRVMLNLIDSNRNRVQIPFSLKNIPASEDEMVIDTAKLTGQFRKNDNPEFNPDDVTNVRILSVYAKLVQNAGSKVIDGRRDFNEFPGGLNDNEIVIKLNNQKIEIKAGGNY